MNTYYTIAVQDIDYTTTRALGLYPTREDAEQAIDPWMHALGASVITVETGYKLVAP